MALAAGQAASQADQEHVTVQPGAARRELLCWPSASKSSAGRRLPAPVSQRRRIRRHPQDRHRPPECFLSDRSWPASHPSLWNALAASARSVSRFIPTSITTAPGLMKSRVIKRGPANGGDQNVGSPALTRQVVGFRMTHGNCRVGMQQHYCHWLAYDIAAPNHHGVLARNRNPIALQHFHDAGRRASSRRGTVRHQIADVHGMKTIRILARINGFQHAAGVHVFRQRHLHEDSVDVGAVVQPGNDAQ